jgi:hypothetical protein
LVIAVLVTLAFMLFLDQGKRCPDDEVSVLGADKWVCVKRGGA